MSPAEDVQKKQSSKRKKKTKDKGKSKRFRREKKGEDAFPEKVSSKNKTKAKKRKSTAIVAQYASVSGVEDAEDNRRPRKETQKAENKKRTKRLRQREKGRVQLSEEGESLSELPKFWDKYKRKLDGGVPRLTEHFVDRGTSADGNFVSSVVDQLLAGRAPCSYCRVSSLGVDKFYITHFCNQICTNTHPHWLRYFSSIR